MKYRLLIIAFLFFNYCNAQNFTITNKRQNIAFVGVINPLEITVDGHPVTDVILTTDNGRIWPQDNGECHFAFVPDKAGYARIDVKIKNKQGEKSIGVYNFVVRKPPTPIVEIGYRSKGGISLERLKSQIGPGISMFSRGMYGYDFHYELSGYTIQVERKHKIIFTHENPQIRFDDVARAFIDKKIKVGDVIILKDIAATSHSNTSLKPEDIRLTILPFADDPYDPNAPVIFKKTEE